EFSHFFHGVFGPLGHALALTPVADTPKQSPFPGVAFWSPPSAVLWTPRPPSRHGPPSPSAYRHRLHPTQAAGEGLSCSTPDCRHVPSSVPRERPALLQYAPPRPLR